MGILKNTLLSVLFVFAKSHDNSVEARGNLRD